MRKSQLSIELYQFFSQQLNDKLSAEISLPKTLDFETVYCFTLDNYLINVQFIIYSSPVPYLDYFIPAREFRAHYRSSCHGRITHSGERLNLENYQGEWGMPYYVDDLERTERERSLIVLHNQRVEAILKQKGFVN